MINIQDIIPFMKDGWVAMDGNCKWFWYDNKPAINKEFFQWSLGDDGDSYEMLNISFDIAPADDWTKSLIKVKGVKR